MVRWKWWDDRGAGHRRRESGDLLWFLVWLHVLATRSGVTSCICPRPERTFAFLEKSTPPDCLSGGNIALLVCRQNPEKIPMKKYVPPTDEEIACCAFAIIARENPMLADNKWREAEAQLIASRKHDAGLLRRTGDRILLHTTLCTA